jgi:hypothetical protein
MMRVEFDYCIMHHCRFRVTNRVSLEPLQASVADELAAAVFAQVTLFSLCGFAIFSRYSLMSISDK